jgi:hypothetical protein
MQFVYDDGGRRAAGFTGDTGDCVTRAIAIVTDKPYREVYDALNAVRDSLRQTKRVRGSAARTGVTRPVYEAYLRSLGWQWFPTMSIGSGCTVHLGDDDLPRDTIICRVSKHMVAVVNGEIRDTHDPSRGGRRCVYGFWKAAS